MAPSNIWQRWKSTVRARFTDVLLRPSLSSRCRLTHDGQRVDSATVGRWGEHLAALWLRKNGRKVLYQNFRGPNGGEVDIVARHGAVLSFVEVKTRTIDAYGRPGDAVNAAKEDLIVRGARAWLKLLGDGNKIRTRCDVAEIVLIEGEKPRVNVVEGAFRF